MQRIFIFSCAILLAFVSSSFVEVETFRTYFQKAFLQSIEGFDALKGSPVKDGWSSSLVMPNFDQTIIIGNASQNLGGFRFSMMGEDISVAEQKLARVQPLIATFLPAGDYVKSTVQDNKYEGSAKTVYQFKTDNESEKQKRPAVEMGVVKTGDYYEAVFIIIEPRVKNLYSPKFN